VLHAAAEQGYVGEGNGAAAGKGPPTSRTDKIPPRLQLLREGESGQVHLRWRPEREPITHQ
jgi:anthraniloyl-CoA monooxygenase